MSQSSLVPVRELMKAICVEAMPGAARKFIDDFVGKLVREFANLGIGGRAAIDLANDGLRGGIADVVHPGVDDDFGGGFGEIAERDEIGIERGIGPGKVAKFAGLREERWAGWDRSWD